jgi:WD40 repeat protein
MIMSQRVHKSAITAVKFVKNDELAVSSSIDGSLILWDLKVAKG